MTLVSVLTPHKNRLVFALCGAAIIGTYQPAARAASFKVNGFTGAFAPPEWTIDNTSGGSTNITPIDATLVLPATGGSASSFIFDTNKLDTSYPGFSQGTVSFDWTWTAPSATPFFASDLQYQINNVNPVVLTRYIGPQPPTIPDVANINNFITTGNNVTFNVSAGDSFLFRLQSINAPFEGSTAVISGFSFTGTYGTAAPAPIPVLGAAAAFGFGRRIRRRLAASTCKASA